jgi:hypothetical protein
VLVVERAMYASEMLGMTLSKTLGTRSPDNHTRDLAEGDSGPDSAVRESRRL